MTAGTLQPDAPFRIGITGKYKLLVKSVMAMRADYEYELIDADGHVYTTRHAKHYVENSLLRCMVFFTIAKAQFSVIKTEICSKQDFAEPIPEPKAVKVNTEPKVIKKSDVVLSPSANKPKNSVLGDPQKVGISGLYKLRVVEKRKRKSDYSYVFSDASGNTYSKKCTSSFRIGQIVPCHMLVVRTKSGYNITITKVQKHKRSKPIDPFLGSSRRSGGGWPTPSVGGYFHLIYTPMGNKR